MDPLLLPWLFVVAGLILPMVAFGVIGFIILTAVRSGSRTPLPLDPAAPVVLHGQLSRDGAGPQTGTVDLDPAWFHWTPDRGQPWRTPISTITVLGSTTAFGISAPHVDLDIEGSGSWRLVVSDRPINRFMRNDATRFREARRGAEFRDRLLAAGARRG